MEFKKLKKFIENNMLSDSILVFENWDIFLVDHYITTIANQKKLCIRYIDSLEYIINDFEDIFNNSILNSELLVYKCDDFKCSDKSIIREKNLIIVTSKITDTDTANLLSDSIIKAPKVQPKHIDEYVELQTPYLKPAQRKWLIDACNNNMYRIQEEIDKLKLFPEKRHPQLFDEFMLDGIFSDLSTDTILSFIEAIMIKDKSTIARILENIKYIDIEPLGVITLLYRNIRLILNVQFNKNITAEDLNIKPGYLYMLKKKCGYYSRDQLVNAFNIITKL